MALTPAYASTPRSIDKAVVATANANLDGTGTIATIATGSAAGFRVQEVVAKAIVTTTAGMIRLYITVDSGTTWELFDELPVPAVTKSASVPASRLSQTYTNLILLGTTNRLGASTEKAESHRVFALGADL